MRRGVVVESEDWRIARVRGRCRLAALQSYERLQWHLSNGIEVVETACGVMKRVSSVKLRGKKSAESATGPAAMASTREMPKCSLRIV
jgi:hypothetical protein